MYVAVWNVDNQSEGSLDINPHFVWVDIGTRPTSKCALYSSRSLSIAHKCEDMRSLLISQFKRLLLETYQSISKPRSYSLRFASFINLLCPLSCVASIHSCHFLKPWAVSKVVLRLLVMIAQCTLLVRRHVASTP